MKAQEVRMSRTTTDNTSEHEHNWIQRLEAVLGGARPERPLVPMNEIVLPDERVPVGNTVREVAAHVGADFDLTYLPSGYIHPETGNFVCPTYERGQYKGDPSDQYILRADTNAVVGNMSGRYPNRDGYKHVFNTLDSMFPESCESVSVYGNGERIVVEQVLDEPFDLGGGDLIQPYIYTRMSLNGTWKTEIIPISRRISCENMLGNIGQLVGVRATRNHDNLLSMRASVVEMSMAQGQALRRMAQVLNDQEFTEGMFQEMLRTVFPTPEPDSHHKTVTAWENKRGAVVRAWHSEEGATMWNAYNAFQGAEQHQINTGGKSTEAATQRALTKALEGKTPIADAAERYLMDLALVGSEEPF